MSGRSFHRRVAITKKPRRQQRSKLLRVILRRRLPAERSWLLVVYSVIMSAMYSGARSCIARKVRTNILYVMRHGAGSQSSAINTSVMWGWSRRHCCVITFSCTHQSCLYICPSCQVYLSVLSMHLPVLSVVLISPF